MMNIQQAVGRHSDVKVWDLSQGINAQIEDNRFSDLAVALDSLQKQYNILICKSAGNIDNPADTSPIIPAEQRGGFCHEPCGRFDSSCKNDGTGRRGK